MSEEHEHNEEGIEVVSGEVEYPALSSPDQLWAVDDHSYEWVTVPEWKMRVRVRGMTGAERDRWEGEMADTQRPGGLAKNWSVNMRARMVSRCVVNEHGESIFNSGMVAALGERNAAALDRVFDVARRLSGLAREDVDELMGNSSSESNAGNGSGSLPISASP